MKTVAIIAEYNPFHKGHIYHLEKALELTGADYSIAIMGGNFLQRGQAAMWDKYTRATMCLTSTLDLVIELPFPYATGSARDFSMGAVSLLNKLNSVDYLCFGAETSDIDALQHIASILTEEPSEYKIHLKNCLAEGMSYPVAREKAIISYTTKKEYSDIISSPNNILAIEYICALKNLNSSIKPIVVERKDAAYHDSTLHQNISSATAIRHFFDTIYAESTKNIELSKLKNSLSEDVFSIIQKNHGIISPIFSDMLTPILQSKLISHGDLSVICDMSNEIANKLNSFDLCNSYSDIIKALKTKDITHSRIARSLIHLLLNYTDDDRKDFIKNGYAFYANILGFKKNSSKLIKLLHDNSDIPLITKKADFEKYILELSDIKKIQAKKMWQLDTEATKLFNCLIYNTYGQKHYNDYNIPLPII